MTVFYILALLAIASALTVILHRNPIYSALALVNTLFVIAVLFVLLDAHLIAFLQVIVYAGAIMVVFLFVLMLLSSGEEVRLEGRAGFRGAAIVASAAIALELGLFGVAAHRGDVELPAGFGKTETLAERLYTTHLLSFELTSVLLLVAVVGAVVMARRKA